jgi:hypothetical protein
MKVGFVEINRRRYGFKKEKGEDRAQIHFAVEKDRHGSIRRSSSQSPDQIPFK